MIKYTLDYNLPITVKGFTLPYGADDYHIVINEKLSPEARLRTIVHELEHIYNCDFDSREASADRIEGGLR